jgi:hypothetical protein
MYIHLSSDRSTAYFSNNTPSAFRVKLSYNINLDPNTEFEIALVQFWAPSFKSGYEPKYVTINTNVCEASILNLALRPILRRLHPDEFGKAVEFSSPQYLTLTSHSLALLDFYLRDEKDSEPSFKEGEVYATLHIKPKD